METVTSSEFQKNFGAFKEIAQREPVTVTSNGRESVVLISATEYAEYKKYIEVKGTEVSDAFKEKVASYIETHHNTLAKLAK